MNTPIRPFSGICAALALLGLSACDREPLEVASRDLGAFEAVDLHGAAEVIITVGLPSSLKIEGSEYTVKHTAAEVSNGALSIEAKKSGWTWFGNGSQLKLTITMPALTSLQSSGAGNIEISGLNGGDQTIRIAGAHNVQAKGRLDKLVIQLEGAGNIDYSRVTAQDAKVVVNGAGHVVVRPTQSLAATMNGIGAVQYEGDPQKVESKINGIGTIGRR